MAGTDSLVRQYPSHEEEWGELYLIPMTVELNFPGAWMSMHAFE